MNDISGTMKNGVLGATLPKNGKRRMLMKWIIGIRSMRYFLF